MAAVAQHILMRSRPEHGAQPPRPPPERPATRTIGADDEALNLVWQRRRASKLVASKIKGGRWKIREVEDEQ